MTTSNQVVIASAGAGKTTSISDLVGDGRRCLVVTYTQNNYEELRSKLIQRYGVVPGNVTVLTWFKFLLRDMVRPYQNHFYHGGRVSRMNHVSGQSARYVAEATLEQHYFDSSGAIYSDKVSKFAVRCNESSDGKVVERLVDLYDHVLIDEVQDLAGWDLEILKLLLCADLSLTLVGDHRQATYRTNNSGKNRKYAKEKIIDLFREWERDGKCKVELMNYSYRCNDKLCRFADSFFPAETESESRNLEKTGHDGVFVLRSADVEEYVKKYSPVVMRYSKRTVVDACNKPYNIGAAKGLTFDRVLIFPHGPLKKLFKTGDYSIIKEPALLYVAFSRAKSSVAVVYDGNLGIDQIEIWQKDDVDE